MNVAKYGIWSFHHDDERVVRGGPPGFWEFMNKIPSNGVILQRLTNSLDKGIILKRVHFRTILHSYKAHLDQLFFGASILPLQVCKELINSGNLQGEQSNSDAPLLYPPRNFKTWGCRQYTPDSRNAPSSRPSSHKAHSGSQHLLPDRNLCGSHVP